MLKFGDRAAFGPMKKENKRAYRKLLRLHQEEGRLGLHAPL